MTYKVPETVEEWKAAAKEQHDYAATFLRERDEARAALARVEKLATSAGRVGVTSEDIRLAIRGDQ